MWKIIVLERITLDGIFVIKQGYFAISIKQALF
jgi:hypothetical protein